MLDKTDLSAMRLYVGCDDIGSIPEEIAVIIGSKSYKASVKIEAQIIEPPKIKISKENWERVEANLEGSTDLNWDTVGGDPKRSQPQPLIGDQIISDRSAIRVNPIGESKSASVITRFEAKRRYTWVRDRSNPPTTGGQTARKADRRVLPKGPRNITILDFGMVSGGSKKEVKQQKVKK